MSFLGNIIERSVTKIFDRCYFPEVWYVAENWLTSVKYRRILDIGCGSGFISAAFAKTGWTVTCVDDSVPSLVKTRKRFAAAELDGRFEQSKFEKIPFSDKSFDVAVCINALEFSLNPARVLVEISRVLRPGGITIIAVFNRRSIWSHPFVAGKVRKDETPREIRSFLKKELLNLVKKAGFTVVKVKDIARYLPLDIGRGKIRWPFTGVFIILAEKQGSSKTENNDPDMTVVKSLSGR